MSSSTTKDTFTLGTRASPLAMIQAKKVQETLEKANPNLKFPISTMSVAGDRDKKQPLYQIGGKSLWTKELEVGLLENAIDIVVHCTKDIPTTLPEGCSLGAILEREDPRDAFIPMKGLPFKSLKVLPKGSVVGTSSIRRTAQLRRNFPDLQFQDMRGNVQTRLDKLDDPETAYTGLILACAGIDRLGLQDRITERLSGPVMFPAVGQGALACEIRQDDDESLAILKTIQHVPTTLAIVAEREMLRVLEGGCSAPLGVESTLTENHQDQDGSSILSLDAVVCSLDGVVWIEQNVSGKVFNEQDAEQLGNKLAKQLLSNGAEKILQDLGKHLENKRATADPTSA